MILILAGNYLEAKRWADSNQLEESEWVCPYDEEEIKKYSNFHVVVVGTAGQNTPASYFNRIFDLAKQRGRIGR